MSTHNICFCREIKNILCGYSLLSVAMKKCLIRSFMVFFFVLCAFQHYLHVSNINMMDGLG